MKKKAISGIILTLLLISMLTLAFNIPASTHASSDWLAGWSYRKSHIISSASGAGTNYQIKLVAHYGNGMDSGEDVYLGSRSLTDFGDVRFTDDDGVTELDYWMEEKVDSDYAIFWVEIEEDLSSVNRKIYVYYGKSDATTTSNGEGTFIFFDDFSGDLSKWTIEDGTWEIVAEELRNTGESYHRFIKAIMSTLSNFAAECKTRMSAVGVYNAPGLCVRYASPDDTYPYAYQHALTTELAEGNRIYEPPVFTLVASGTFSFSPDATYKQRITAYSTTLKAYIDDENEISGTDPTLTSGVMAVSSKMANGKYAYFDDVRVRKFVDPEPSHGSWGVEEPIPPTASFAFSPAEPIVAETVTFDASASNDPDGTIVSYAWDFGDGNTTTTADTIITHAYTLSGTYNVTLTVTDNDGLTDTAAELVTVTSPPAPLMLSIKLSGEFDYSLREEVRIRLAALVRYVVTMEPVSNANVTMQIYDETGILRISSVMVEKLAGTGIYEWTSSRTIKDLGPNKGIYLVRAQASFEDSPLAHDIVLFHIDPPASMHALSGDYDDLLNKLLDIYSQLQSDYNDLKSKYDTLTGDLGTAINLSYLFIITTIVFIATTVYLTIRKTKVKPESKTT